MSNTEATEQHPYWIVAELIWRGEKIFEELLNRPGA